MNYFLILITFFFLFIFFQTHAKLAKYLNLYDLPNERKIHNKKVPLTGGIGLFLLFLLFFLFHQLNFIEFTNLFHLIYFLEYKLLYFLTLMFLIGFLDDKKNLSALKKTIFLIIVFIIFVSKVKILQINDININGVVVNLEHLKLSIIFTVFCFFIFNISFNMFDGINLQSCIYSIFFCLNLYLLNNDHFLLILILFLLFFAIYNRNSQIFLGDSGCNILSTILSIYCIAFHSLGIILIEQILILMLFPGLDMARLFFTRLLNKKSPFVADKFHLHHYIIKSYSYYAMIFFLISVLIVKSILFFYFPNFYSLLVLSTIYFTVFFVASKNYIKKI